MGIIANYVVCHIQQVNNQQPRASKPVQEGGKDQQAMSLQDLPPALCG